MKKKWGIVALGWAAAIHIHRPPVGRLVAAVVGEVLETADVGRLQLAAAAAAGGAASVGGCRWRLLVAAAEAEEVVGPGRFNQIIKILKFKYLSLLKLNSN
jgi:hypothetical protein